MLKVLCARSMHVAVTALAGAFSEHAGVAADLVFEPMGALQARLAAGETADVLILAMPAVAALARSGAVLPDSGVAVGRAPIGVAVRAGTALPDIGAPEAFTATLVAASRIALSDPAVGGSAGIYLRDLFARLGLADLVAARTVPQPSGVAAAACVGRGEADLALTFIPELLQASGVHIVGPLPPPFGHATAYGAAIGAGSLHIAAAGAFIAALTAPAARDTWTAAGFAFG